MKRKEKKRLPERRKLSITTAGKFYVGLSIAFGVVAITSGNNILYLLESFLLGGLILSGVLSELSVSSVELKWKRLPAVAGEACRDVILVQNKLRAPIYCLQIGEWRKGKFQPRAFVPYLPPKSTTEIHANWSFPERGTHSWDGIAYATDYPFGFARKLRCQLISGSRLIWPKRSAITAVIHEPSKEQSTLQSERSATHRAVHGNITEGEVRPFVEGDDFRHVVWTLSEKREQLLVRMRGADLAEEEAVLDLRIDPGEAFERRVSETAEKIYEKRPHLNQLFSESATLTLIDWDGKHRITGRKTQLLDVLASCKSAGNSPAASKTVKSWRKFA